jgi:iron-sulfur cluster repair protein YtfE (RIC family)
MPNIGSKPATRLRGAPAIFGTLIDDHDRHRSLLAQLADTHGDTRERRSLFRELTHELNGHAAAEEQALWSTVLRKPAITEEGRHAVAEHKEIDDLLVELAASDMASGGWLLRFFRLREEYLHHIKEEEQDIFPAVGRELSDADKRYMNGVFVRRKAVEKRKARVTRKSKHPE